MSAEPARANAIRMHQNDSVAVLVRDVAKGEPVILQGEREPAVIAKEPIPYGHKVALRPVKAGEPVIKYGERIGIASQDIAAGEHVHVHNVRGLKPSERGVRAHG